MALTGELVPVKIDYHDERGWTDQESATSDKMRTTWVIEPKTPYTRVQSYNGLIKIFQPQIDNTGEAPLELQSNVGKDTAGNFPSVFYYKNA